MAKSNQTEVTQEEINLYKEWIKFKKTETKAKQSRNEVEAKIEALLPKIDGKSKTFHNSGFKLEVKKNEKYSFRENWEDVREEIQEELRPEKIKYEVVEKGLNWLKENNKEVYKKISDCIDFKPKKMSITVTKE